MKLTRASSYALHAVAYMAAQKTNAPVASHKIAKSRGIPDRFLLKVLKPLVNEGVLVSIKGPHGGYKLAKPANQISMLDILEAVDGPICGKAPEFKENNGPLNERLETICRQSADQVRKQLEKVRITDLVAKKEREGTTTRAKATVGVD